jgi:hypothetical protein
VITAMSALYTAFWSVAPGTLYMWASMWFRSNEE